MPLFPTIDHRNLVFRFFQEINQCFVTYAH